ncbi:MAG: M48 family metallopeptidase, partial [Candidatus Promineifilaceae bacterium]
IVQKQGQFAAHPRPPVLHYAAGETHYYLGQPYTLHVSQGRPQGATLDGRLLRLSVSDVNEEARRRQVLIEWYRARARELFPARLEACYAAAAQHSLPYPALKIRLLKARWGSCASTGFITLNLRLVQVPLQLIDYVIYHELAHLRVPAHNKAFYALLGELLPDWRARRAALNQFPAA